ncbi:hypothetical protein IWQ62_003818 [Dispira parvispora]|uniref:Uncharacterized protein n=1 Tax=Dispira parvispora TaxID=1520584 RepID=A0A9W8E1A1_9FUNG|nr:hypothetical protein IWQ62_003818 [Dispira parvispora]
MKPKKTSVIRQNRSSSKWSSGSLPSNGVKGVRGPSKTSSKKKKKRTKATTHQLRCELNQADLSTHCGTLAEAIRGIPPTLPQTTADEAARIAQEKDDEAQRYDRMVADLAAISKGLTNVL